MRKSGFVALLLAVGMLVGVRVLHAQVGNNLILLSNWDNNNLPVSYNLVYNEVFGWAAPSGAEYAILGSHQRTYFIEVTNPTTPVVRDSVEGTYPVCIHRDFKTYGHYCYGVADEGPSTFQVMDMAFLPDSVHVTFNSAQYFERAHNIFIDTTRGRLYVAGSNTQNAGLIVFDIASNPAVPTLLASVNLGHYVHDLSVRNDTAYLNCGYDGLFIYNFAIPTAPVLLANLTSYPQQGYNHSSWLTEDGKYLAMCDETRNKSCKMVDVRNMNNVGVVSLYRSALLAPNDTTSIPHNPLIIGNYVCVAYYHDGVQIWDITNPNLPQHVAGYDTWPNNVNYNDYYGAWGCYPFLPSGTVLGSDVHNGLFVFRVPFAFPRPITAEVLSTPATCSNTPTGAATVTPSGGTHPYSYAWSSGQSTASVQGMLPGTYTVTISDRYGYNIVQTVTIAGPAPLLGNAQVAAETCAGTGDGAIDLLPSGGTQPYSFHWNTGDLVEDLVGVSAGTYTVTITDGAGCVRIETVSVSTLNAAPQAVAGPDTILCNDGLLVQAQTPLSGTGHWEWISGNGQIQNPNLTSTQLSGLNAGLNLLAWVVFDGQCAAEDTMAIYVSSTAHIDAGPDQVVCGTAINLQGSPTGGGQGNWAAMPSNVTFSNVGDPQAQVSGLMPGNYVLYWSVSEGNCQAADSLELFVSNTPFAAFSFSTNGMLVSFTNVSQFATSWLWTFGDGSTSNLQSPNHTYAANGFYNVCLIATDTCGSDTTCQTVNISVLGNASSLSPAVNIWPNPTQQLLHITIPDQAGESIHYQLCDISGRVLGRGEWQATGEDMVLDMGSVSAGMYFVRLQGDAWQSVHKVYKQ